MPSENFFTTHPLIAATLAVTTQKAYTSAFRDFIRVLPHHPTSVFDLDVALHTCIDEAYNEDPSPGNRQRMCYLVSFLSLSCPHAKKELGISRRALSGWNKLKPPCSALPLTRQIMLAFSHYFQERGSLSAAVALALQWSTYMRGSEVLNLRKTDIALPGDPRLHHAGFFGGVNIELSKTGPMQFTLIRDREIIALLDAFLHRNAHNTSIKLFNISYRTYNSFFKEAAAYFGLDNKRMTSHSARIGGAITDYCRGISAETIAITGRWKSFTSLERYLRNGRSWLLQMPMRSFSQTRISSHASEFTKLIKDCQAYSDFQPQRQNYRRTSRAMRDGNRDELQSRWRASS